MQPIFIWIARYAGYLDMNLPPLNPFVMLVGGLCLVAVSVWRWWRPRKVDENDRRYHRQISCVAILIGLVLVAIGGSRFAHGYGIKWGQTLIALGPISIPSWETV